MEEEYRDIKGFEGMYQVSNLGRVRSLDRIDCAGRKLRGAPIAFNVYKGYRGVWLNKDSKGTYRRIHRLVGETFIPNPEGKRTINHKDGDKSNNRVSNLEWATHTENSLHAFANGLRRPKRKIDVKDIPEILNLRKSGETYEKIAQRYGVTKACIHHIVAGKTYRKKT